MYLLDYVLAKYLIPLTSKLETFSSFFINKIISEKIEIFQHACAATKLFNKNRWGERHFALLNFRPEGTPPPDPLKTDASAPVLFG